MRPLRDPEGAELDHLLNACQLKGKKILEIGCGDGKFTFQYSGMAHRVIGIDPKASDLMAAKCDERGSNSFFIQSMAERMPFPSKFFDIVIFASAL